MFLTNNERLYRAAQAYAKATRDHYSASILKKMNVAIMSEEERIFCQKLLKRTF